MCVSSCISIVLPEQRAVGFSEYNHIPSPSGGVPSQWGPKPPYRGKQIKKKRKLRTHNHFAGVPRLVRSSNHGEPTGFSKSNHILPDQLAQSSQTAPVLLSHPSLSPHNSKNATDGGGREIVTYLKDSLHLGNAAQRRKCDPSRLQNGGGSPRPSSLDPERDNVGRIGSEHPTGATGVGRATLAAGQVRAA